MGMQEDSRSKDLEDQREWYENALEAGLALAEETARSESGVDPDVILRDVLLRLRRLYGFVVLGFARVDEADQSFQLHNCHPEGSGPYIQQEIDQQIESGTFGWTLTQTHALLGRSHDRRYTVVTHVVSTRSRIRGMFIGFLDCRLGDVKDSIMHVLSMILLNAANTLESHALYQLLREQNRNLERIVEQRTADLEKARREAEAANQAKGQFIANISHEIRTPLTSIIGFAELGGRDGAALAVDEYRDALTTIHTAGRHLLEIINNILDLSKLESDQYELEILPVSPLEIVGRVNAVMLLAARRKGLDFSLHCEFPVPALILTDPTRLTQILLNLCGNAIKFTASGHVRVEVSYDRNEGEIRFAVIDSGIGLSEGQRAALFQPFTQADASTTRKYGGTGLGLYISKQLAERLGGRIMVESAPDRGSRFTVTLPAGSLRADDLVHAWPGDRRQSSGEMEPTPVLRGRVLVAEDDPNIQRLIGLYLRDTDVAVTVVENGAKAVERALAEDYDLLVTDLQMPEMGGLEAVDWLRKAGFSKPVIVLSADAGSGLEERCREVGCTDYLPKPFERRRLLEMLARHLGGAIDADAAANLELDPAYRRARATFMEMLRDAPGEMAAQVGRGDWEGLSRLAHRIKGSAGAFGYAEIGIAAGDIEAVARADSHEPVGSMLEVFNREISRLLGSRDSSSLDSPAGSGGRRRRAG